MTGDINRRDPATLDGLVALGESLAVFATAIWQLRQAQSPTDWCRSGRVLWVEADENVDGRYLAGPMPRIVLRRGLSEPARRFTMTHELGHHIVHQCRENPDVRRLLPAPSRRQLAAFAPASDYEELVCDAFAAALLLPSHAVMHWSQRSHLNAGALVELSRTHSVRLDACLRRLKAVSGFQATLVELQPDMGYELLASTQRIWPLSRKARLRSSPCGLTVSHLDQNPKWFDWATDGWLSHRTKATCAVSVAGTTVMLVGGVAGVTRTERQPGVSHVPGNDRQVVVSGSDRTR